MRLNKLEMHRFGKFVGTEWSLSEGLSEFILPNESGKTTVTDFILFMFYGFEKSRAKKALEQNPLEKYQPWDSEQGLLGALEFTDDSGANYRIERSCDKKGKGEVRVLDANGCEQPMLSPGERFLGIDAETFINVFYIGQSGAALQRTGRMDVAMKNLVTTGNEDVSYDRVIEKLAAQKAKLTSPKRNMGKLRQLQQTLSALQGDISMTKLEIDKAGDVTRLQQQTEAQLSESEARLGELHSLRRRVQAHTAFLRMEERQKLKKLLEGQPAQEILSDEDAKKLSEGFDALENAKMMQKHAEFSLEQLSLAPVTLTAQEQMLLEQGSLPRLPLWRIAAAVLGSVAAATGVILAVLSQIGWAALCVGALALLLLHRPLPRALREMGIRDKGELERRLAAANVKNANVEQYRTALSQAEAELSRRKKQTETIQNEYAPLMEKCSVFDRMQLQLALQRSAQSSLHAEQTEKAKERLRELSGSEEKDREIACRSESPLPAADALQEQITALTGQREKLLVQQADNAVAMEQLRALHQRLSELQDEYVQREAEYRQAAFLNEALEIAMQEMEKAQTRLRENYAPLLCEKLAQNLSALTDGKYDTVTLDEDFHIRIKADGGFRELGYFSSGTRESAYIALRLALAELVEGEYSLPLILDDPFATLDEKRLKNLFARLQKMAEKRQIVYFGCKKY